MFHVELKFYTSHTDIDESEAQKLLDEVNGWWTKFSIVLDVIGEEFMLDLRTEWISLKIFLLRALGKWQEAIKLLQAEHVVFRENLEMFTEDERYRCYLPHYIDSLCPELIFLLCDANRIYEAQREYQIWETCSSGFSFCTGINASKARCHCLLRLGRFTEALPLLKAQLDLELRTLGSTHPDTNDTYALLAIAFFETQKLEECRDCCRRLKSYADSMCRDWRTVQWKVDLSRYIPLFENLKKQGVKMKRLDIFRICSNPKCGKVRMTILWITVFLNIYVYSRKMRNASGSEKDV